jgi:hypothetical protein
MSLIHQIRVVLLSYLTRTGFRWAAIGLISGFATFFGAIGVWLLCKHFGYGQQDLRDWLLAPMGLSEIAIICSLGSALLLFFIHARQQLMGQSARILPTGRSANLIVAGMIYFAIIGLMMAWFAMVNDPPNFHYFGVFLVILSFMTMIAIAVSKPWLIPLPLFAWWLCSKNLWGMTIFVDVVINFGRNSRPAPNGLVRQLWDEHIRVVWVTRVALALLNVIGLFILEKLARPKPKHPSVFSKLRESTQREPSRQTYVARPHRVLSSHWARSMHRRLAVHDWRATSVVAAAMCVLTVLLSIEFDRLAVPPTMIALLTVLPGALLAVGWRERWSSYEFESLYPATQRQFAGEMAAGLLLDAAEFWLAGAAAMLLTLLITRPQTLIESRFLAMLLGSAMLQFMWVGAILLIGQRRQTATFIAGLVPFGVMVFMSFTSVYRSNPSELPTKFLVAAVIEMTLGLLMLVGVMFNRRRQRIA